MAEHDDAPTRREAELNAKIAAIQAEIAAMNKALRLTEEFPTAIDKAIRHLKELHGQRFAAMEQRLEEQRRAEKEARDKAEKGMIQQVRGLEQQYQSRHETLRTMIDGLEKSITRLDGERKGASANWAYIVGIVGILIAALTFMIRLPW